jgi:hypothetical protein
MGRHEQVRDHVADCQPQWREHLTLGAPDADSTGGISADSDPQQSRPNSVRSSPKPTSPPFLYGDNTIIDRAREELSACVSSSLTDRAAPSEQLKIARHHKSGCLTARQQSTRNSP